MARLSFNEIRAKIAAEFPDNVAGFITPARLRTVMLDILNAIQPAYGALTAVGPVVKVTNIIASQLTGYGSAFDSDPAQTTSDAGGGTIQRAERGTSTINFTTDFECATGRFVTFILYKNGVATTWRTTGNGGGAGNPISVAFTAIDYNDPAPIYTVWVSSEVDGNSVTLSSVAFIVQLEAVNAF